MFSTSARTNVELEIIYRVQFLPLVRKQEQNSNFFNENAFYCHHEMSVCCPMKARFEIGKVYTEISNCVVFVF